MVDGGDFSSAEYYSELRTDDDVELGSLADPLNPVRHGRPQRASCLFRCCDKGTISNFAFLCVMIIGFFLVYFEIPWVGPYVFSFGMFGFSGGITNSIAIKMLFDKIPCVYGSGIIPKKFEQIRESIKNVVMAMFFDKEYLSQYIGSKVGTIASGLNLEVKIQQLMQSEAMENIIDQKLFELENRPEGMFLAMMNIPPSTIKPLIMPFVLSMSADVTPAIMRMIDPSNGGSAFNIDSIHAELDTILTQKLGSLTPNDVKRVLEDVIRQHLWWLVLWGNVLGGILGVIAQLAGVSSFLENVEGASLAWFAV